MESSKIKINVWQMGYTNIEDFKKKKQTKEKQNVLIRDMYS
jgi:hypothetical protein